MCWGDLVACGCFWTPSSSNFCWRHCRFHLSAMANEIVRRKRILFFVWHRSVSVEVLSDWRMFKDNYGNPGWSGTSNSASLQSRKDCELWGDFCLHLYFWQVTWKVWNLTFERSEKINEPQIPSGSVLPENQSSLTLISDLQQADNIDWIDTVSEVINNWCLWYYNYVLLSLFNNLSLFLTCFLHFRHSR